MLCHHILQQQVVSCTHDPCKIHWWDNEACQVFYSSWGAVQTGWHIHEPLILWCTHLWSQQLEPLLVGELRLVHMCSLVNDHGRTDLPTGILEGDNSTWIPLTSLKKADNSLYHQLPKMVVSLIICNKWNDAHTCIIAKISFLFLHKKGN